MNLDFLYRPTDSATLQDDPSAPLDFMLHDDDVALRQQLTTQAAPAFVHDVIGLFVRGNPVPIEFVKLLGRRWTSQPAANGSQMLTIADFYRPDLLSATLHQVPSATLRRELIQAVTLTLHAPTTDVHALAAAYVDILLPHAQEPTLRLRPRTPALPIGDVRLTPEPNGGLAIEILCATADEQ
jgi:hypothetical protein